MAIEVDGTKYKVVESHGFVPSIGLHAKTVLVDGVERKVVKDHGHWRFWSVPDRMSPVVEYAARLARMKEQGEG